MSKPRKPAPFHMRGYSYDSFEPDELYGRRYINVDLPAPLEPDDAPSMRRLAAWLLRAADWLEAGKGEP